jgi:hypothetical protein
LFCGSCGKVVSEGAKFCDSCGAPVAAPIGQSVPAPSTAAAAPAPAAIDYPAPSAEHSSKAPLIILAVFVLVMAVLGYEMLQFKRAGKKASGVDVSVIPAQLTLRPGESHLIEATVLGTENNDVGWTVQEGAAGGSVVPNGATAHDGHVFSAGKYTAPATPGTYHVIANSKADESRASSATIVVTR